MARSRGVRTAMLCHTSAVSSDEVRRTLSAEEGLEGRDGEHVAPAEQNPERLGRTFIVGRQVSPKIGGSTWAGTEPREDRAGAERQDHCLDMDLV
jgi:hypothetical protein